VIVGHLGPAGAVRARWRTTALPWLLVAALAPDLLDASLAAAGVCNPYGLYSHTVPAVLLLAAVLGGAAFLMESRATAVACVALVFLHLPLDYLTGNKLYWPGGAMYGLRLYQRPFADFVLEVPIIVTGWWLLRRSASPPRWAVSRVALLALVAAQATVDLMDRSWKPNACAAADAPLR
jgi:hypothetical protein